jgi:hypothetical protein
MTQAFDGSTPFFRTPAGVSASVVSRVVDWSLNWLRRLLTDGLTADAFLVLSDGASIAVLLRRPDGAYVIVARDAIASGLEGSSFREPDIARDALARETRRDVTLAPVWYS